MTIEEGAEDMEINKNYVKGRLDEKERIKKLIDEMVGTIPLINAEELKSKIKGK